MGKLGRKAHVKKVQSKFKKLKNARNSKLKNTIRDLKGEKFTGRFICAICGHTYMTGYFYSIENAEYEICKFCHDSIFDIGHRMKVVYTPMGNKR